MKTYNVSSFSGLHKIITQHWNGHFVYRGEESVKYLLKSSFGRDQSNNAINNQGLEKSYLQDFKKSALPFLEYNPASELEWLAIAQHHGLHTRLLDWSSNPLVAAYFAVKNVMADGNSVLYILDRAALKLANDNLNPFTIKEDYIYYPRHLSKRIIAQSGLFTLHHKPDQVFNGNYLEKVIISRKCIVDILVTLDVYNVNEFSLFPGLPGLADFLTSRYIRPKKISNK